MDLTSMFHGFLLGLAIAAPVGPVGIVVIRRTITFGRGVGLISGLGAATADAFYAAVAAFGLTVISTFLVSAGSCWSTVRPALS